MAAFPPKTPRGLPGAKTQETEKLWSAGHPDVERIMVGRMRKRLRGIDRSTLLSVSLAGSNPARDRLAE
jgi:hypothetical protein